MTRAQDTNSTLTDGDTGQDMDEMDIEGLMEMKASTPRKKIPRSGVPKAHICPVCQLQLLSRLALERHLKSLHPLSHCFSCEHCRARFHNPREVTSHKANVHNPRKVLCKQCPYQTVLKAKMQ